MSKMKKRGLAALVVVLLALTTSNAVVLAGGGFTDVGPGHPFEDEIGWMAEYEISEGDQDGSDGPGAPVNGQAMSAFMEGLAATYHIVEDTKEPGASQIISGAATGPVGDQALAGGSDIVGSFSHVVWKSYPDGRDWNVSWITTDGNTPNPTSVTIWALCGPEPLPEEM